MLEWSEQSLHYHLRAEIEPRLHSYLAREFRRTLRAHGLALVQQAVSIDTLFFALGSNEQSSSRPSQRLMHFYAPIFRSIHGERGTSTFFPSTLTTVVIASYLIWRAYRTKRATPDGMIVPQIRLRNIAILLAASLAVISAVVLTGWLITAATTPHQYAAHIGTTRCSGLSPRSRSATTHSMLHDRRRTVTSGKRWPTVGPSANIHACMNGFNARRWSRRRPARGSSNREARTPFTAFLFLQLPPAALLRQKKNSNTPFVGRAHVC
jgi:hypothetical protein